MIFKFLEKRKIKKLKDEIELLIFSIEYKAKKLMRSNLIEEKQRLEKELIEEEKVLKDYRNKLRKSEEEIKCLQRLSIKNKMKKKIKRIIKTILFKLRLRKLKEGDFITVIDERGILRYYRVIGEEFKIKIDEYNKHETKGRVAVLNLYGFPIRPENFQCFHIDKSYIGFKYTLLRTSDVMKVD